MKHLAILGPGLLGGSLALRAKALGGCKVSIWSRRAEIVDEILRSGSADAASTNPCEVSANADLVILCVPVPAMADVARQVAPCLQPGAVVTDVGSVKAYPVRELSPIFRGTTQFVGSHPMAGNQFKGFHSADPSLYAGTTCIVTPDPQTDSSALLTVSDFWKWIGCRVVCMQPLEHDVSVALVSHLPHIVAGALIHTVAHSRREAFNVVGPGFRDSTRVASGPADLWVSILRENSHAVSAALDAMIAKLSSFRQMLAAPDAGDEALYQYLSEAKEIRDSITFPR